MLTKFLGAFLQVSYRDALNLADKYLEANLTTNISKKSLAFVFAKYL